MRSTLITSLTLALTASAFLVPPQISDTAWENTLATAVHVDPTTQRQVISLDCPSCPFASEGKHGESISWIHGIENSLRMEFTVKDKQLSLNGMPFFPPNIGPKGPPFMSARQDPKPGVEVKDSTPFGGTLPLSTQIEVKGTEVIKANDGDMKIFKIDLEPLGISDKVIRVPTIQIALAEVNEKFYLLSIKTRPYKPILGSHKCTTIFCRVRASIAAKITALRAAAASRFGSIKGGCLRKFGHLSNNGPMVKGGVPKYVGKFPPKHEHHNFHGFSQNGNFHHRHHHRHGVAHMLFNFVKTIMIPIFVGIIVGVAVGGIGLFIGQVIVFIWMRYRGIHSHTYDRVQQDEENESTDCPPKYEEVYEDQAKDTVGEKGATL